MKALLFVLIFGLCGCAQPVDDRESSSPTEPKSLYGQSVKKARDLRNPSGQAEDTKRQAEELFDHK